tara:strand:- start:740 stop:895 length:156 start_codon:yes stop_codon:yes gene_type:complete
MDTVEWIGFFVFLVVVVLLFFAAFGGSNLTDQSVEEYMTRLMKEAQDDKKK